MHYDIKVPNAGESINEVEILRWLFKDGDHVPKGTELCELETDKATLSVYSEGEGRLEIKAEPGKTVGIGDIIAAIYTEGLSPSTTSAPPSSAVPSLQPIGNEPSLSIKVPNAGESINEVELLRWLFKDGDFVPKDAELCELETDKATLSVHADQSGILKIIAHVGTVLSIGAVVGEISLQPSQSGSASSNPNTQTASPANADAQPRASYAAGHPSPAAKNILTHAGISPEIIQGSGKDGRITQEDAQKAASSSTPEPSVSSSSSAPHISGPDSLPHRAVKRERMSSLRRKIASRLVKVKNETAMLTTFNEVDMSAIAAIRQSHKIEFEKKYGVRLGFMSFFAVACVRALKDYPAVNSQLDGDDLISYSYVDLGIAVSTDRGLMVPVLRNVESKSIAEIEKDIVDLATKARTQKISPSELSGGTFTITNGGVFGSLLATPILNPPQVAILGMHNIVERPVVVDKSIVIRPMMYVALSYDHRVIDGRESVSFLKNVKGYLEDPSRLVIGV